MVQACGAPFPSDYSYDYNSYDYGYSTYNHDEPEVCASYMPEPEISPASPSPSPYPVYSPSPTPTPMTKIDQTIEEYHYENLDSEEKEEELIYEEDDEVLQEKPLQRERGNYREYTEEIEKAKRYYYSRDIAPGTRIHKRKKIQIKEQPFYDENDTYKEENNHKKTMICSEETVFDSNGDALQEYRCRPFKKEVNFPNP